MKKCNQPPNAELGYEQLLELKVKWDDNYPNAMESLNNTYKKLNAQRSAFQSDKALLKSL